MQLIVGHGRIWLWSSWLGVYPQAVCRAVLGKVQDRDREADEEVVGRPVLPPEREEVDEREDRRWISPRIYAVYSHPHLQGKTGIRNSIVTESSHL